MCVAKDRRDIIISLVLPLPNLVSTVMMFIYLPTMLLAVSSAAAVFGCAHTRNVIILKYPANAGGNCARRSFRIHLQRFRTRYTLSQLRSVFILLFVFLFLWSVYMCVCLFDK